MQTDRQTDRQAYSIICASIPQPPCADVKERVALYLYSPSGHSGPVVGWTLPSSVQTITWECAECTHECCEHTMLQAIRIPYTHSRVRVLPVFSERRHSVGTRWLFPPLVTAVYVPFGRNCLDRRVFGVVPPSSCVRLFTTNRTVCPQTTIYNTPIPMKSEVTHIGLHLDQRLTWQARIKAKRQQLNLWVKNTAGLSAKPLNCRWKTNCCCIKPH